MTKPMFVDIPKRLSKLSRADGSETILDTEMGIRLAMGVIAGTNRLEWGTIIEALERGQEFATFGFVYRLPKGGAA